MNKMRFISVIGFQSHTHSFWLFAYTESTTCLLLIPYKNLLFTSMLFFFSSDYDKQSNPLFNGFVAHFIAWDWGDSFTHGNIFHGILLKRIKIHLHHHNTRTVNTFYQDEREWRSHLRKSRMAIKTWVTEEILQLDSVNKLISVNSQLSPISVGVSLSRSPLNNHHYLVRHQPSKSTTKTAIHESAKLIVHLLSDQFNILNIYYRQ